VTAPGTGSAVSPAEALHQARESARQAARDAAEAIHVADVHSWRQAVVEAVQGASAAQQVAFIVTTAE
jgi:hypothetical protein